jgi:hypothetical protein
MMQFLNLITQASSSAIIGCIISFLFWKADDFLSDTARKLIYRQILDIASTPNDPSIATALHEFIDRYYSRTLPAGRALSNLVLFSVGSIIIILSVYISHTENLYEPLIHNDDVRAEYIKEVIGYGLVVVLLVNYAGFFFDQIVWNIQPQIPLRHAYLIMLAEMLLKIVLFIVFMAIMSTLFVTLRELYPGSPLAALKSLPQTLIGALTFQDDTGVFLYSTAISSFPTFIVALIGLMGSHPILARVIQSILFWLNFENRPIRALSVVLSIMLATFSFGVYLAASLLQMFA